MIKGKDIYEVVAALVPLYMALFLGYGSVRWWKIFTPEQCSGINRFVSVFAVPFLSFSFISSNNPYTMNFRFLAADSLQKLVILVALFLFNTFTKWGSIDTSITIFSLSTLPNTLVMGVPLLKAMYGEFTQQLMIQIVVFQCVIWYTVLLILFEYRGAKLLISEKFPDTAGAISTLRVDSNVGSLSGREPLQTDAEIGENGELHVVVSRSMSMVSPRPSNVSRVEIYSVPSSSQRASSSSLHGGADSEELMVQNKKHEKGSISRSKSVGDDLVSPSLEPRFNGATNKDKGLHMFANFDVNMKHGVNKAASAVDFPHETSSSKAVHVLEIEEAKLAVMGRTEEGHANKQQEMPCATLMIKLILTMLWRNLIRNPNNWASVLGLIWSVIFFRWKINTPLIVEKSIKIMSDTGLGMAMFSLGLFMASQPKIITCGKTRAGISMVIRFLVGPVVILATSKVMGIHGVLLRVTIIQAALPQAIVPFVFAKEYNLQPDIFSTAVIFGMVIALPVTIIYYVLLGL